jgi:hypothetical protein
MKVKRTEKVVLPIEVIGREDPLPTTMDEESVGRSG